MKNFRSLILGISIIGLLSAGIVLLGACSNDTDKATPTGPDSQNYQTISAPTPLSDLLDFNWNDVTNLSLSKYQDDQKIYTVVINTEENLLQVQETLKQFKLASATQDNDPAPANNTKYELTVNNVIGGSNKKFTLSIGPVYKDGSFVVGGTYVQAQKLDPKKALLQKNDLITFAAAGEFFDGMFRKLSP
ncbi:MAG TPA: hypothetical protein PKW24_05510 [Clostridiales bacterium]|jgi:hypothetical protein|nr:hypothetical protein [Clostridiales bacterium]